MKINSQQYAEVLFDIIKTKKELDLDRSVLKFAEILTSRNDQFLLEKIIRDLDVLWLKDNSIVRAEIESARALDPQTLSVLEKKLKNLTKAKELLLTEKVDSRLMGGAVIRYADKILDASLKNRLEKFKESIIV